MVGDRPSAPDLLDPVHSANAERARAPDKVRTMCAQRRVVCALNSAVGDAGSPDRSRLLSSPPSKGVDRGDSCAQAASVSSLLIVAGPPGAGKSTVSAVVSGHLSPSVLIRGDAFYRFLDQGSVAAWLPEATDQNRVVIRASGAAAGQYARGGYETVFDGVLGPWWLPTFAMATGLDALHYAILLPSEERCVQNVAAREGRGNFDERATRDMHENFERVLAELDDRHVMREPAATPEDTATELLSRYRDGLFAYSPRSH